MIFYPEERIALFIDGANLYSAARGLAFDIDYKRLLDLFRSKGRLIRAFYYTALIEDQEYSPIRPLVDWLDYNGYTMVTKPTKEFTDAMGRRRIKGNMDIELAIDMLEMARHIDHAVLFSGDGDFRRLVEAVQRRGVRVSVSRRSAPRRRWSPTICAARPTTSSSSGTGAEHHAQPPPARRVRRPRPTTGREARDGVLAGVPSPGLPACALGSPTSARRSGGPIRNGTMRRCRPSATLEREC